MLSVYVARLWWYDRFMRIRKCRSSKTKQIEFYRELNGSVVELPPGPNLLYNSPSLYGRIIISMTARLRIRKENKRKSNEPIFKLQKRTYVKLRKMFSTGKNWFSTKYKTSGKSSNEVLISQSHRSSTFYLKSLPNVQHCSQKESLTYSLEMDHS